MITASWLGQHFPQMKDFAPLGEGGQKWVFSATHAMDGPVVFKLIKPNQNADRVQREVLAVQQVRSPRVPHVMDAGVIDAPVGQCIWLREQRVTGDSVRQVLRTRVLTVDEARRLSLHVLEALADVERAHIVHRDVKPDNVMRDDAGVFWLLDFGIARHLDLMSLTATNALAGPGTLGYAPPEQARNHKRDVDGRADLFALAVTLVECLTGRHPFRDGARDAAEVFRRVETTPLVVPAISGAGGGAFRDLIATMGQRRVDCRPPNAAEALAWMREINNAAQP